MILGVHHVAVATFDIERLAQFYCDAFGFKVVKVGGWERDSVRHELVTGLKASAAKSWMIQGPNFFIELFEYSEPKGVTSGERRLCDPDLSHERGHPIGVSSQIHLAGGKVCRTAERGHGRGEDPAAPGIAIVSNPTGRCS